MLKKKSTLRVDRLLVRRVTTPMKVLENSYFEE
jgi:hypothetical protein